MTLLLEGLAGQPLGSLLLPAAPLFAPLGSRLASFRPLWGSLWVAFGLSLVSGARMHPKRNQNIPQKCQSGAKTVPTWSLKLENLKNLKISKT